MALIADWEPKELRIHLTNVVGLGAVQLVGSLLPALEKVIGLQILELHMPDRGALATFQPRTGFTSLRPYRRLLPKALSRFFECSLRWERFQGKGPILVLGDLPIITRAPQMVFLQTPHLTEGPRAGFVDRIRFGLAKKILHRNLKWVDHLVVQTSVMEDAVHAAFPEFLGKVWVIPQPIPAWLMTAKCRDLGRKRVLGRNLRLFYPAAGYPHKNHGLLTKLSPSVAGTWPVERLGLTLPADTNPNPGVHWLECLGQLGPADMIDQYRVADGLVFLSKAESYGFPLIEAMWIGLPILCPNLPYARVLCGEQAIYFDPENVQSLGLAISELHHRLEIGWCPDWSRQLEGVPRDWDEVAHQMVQILFETNSAPH